MCLCWVKTIHRIENHLLICFSNLALKTVDENDLPRLMSLKEFDLHMMTNCDLNCLSAIFHCTPNLKQFSFTFIHQHLQTTSIDSLFDGNNWQQILTNRLPKLIKFDMYISFLITNQEFDSKRIVESFRCFVKEYPNWHLSVSRWKSFVDFVQCKFKDNDDLKIRIVNLGERIVLRTFDYKCLVKPLKCFSLANICVNTFETISTTDMSFDHYFQSHINSIEFYLPVCEAHKMNLLCRNIPFRNVNHLIIRLSLIKSRLMAFLNSLFRPSEQD